MQVNATMNIKNENFTPRERVDAQLLAQLLSENDDMDSERRDESGNFPPRAESVPTTAQPQMYRGNTRRSCQPRQRMCPYVTNTDSPAYGRSLAMVYSPKQEFTDLYEAEEGLRRGTIFMQLDKPLEVGCCQEGRWKA